MSNRRSVVALALASAALAPQAAKAWTKSYLIEYMEPAFYYGAGADGGEETPGTDCPKGINHEMNWQKELTTKYRTAAETAAILNPEHRGQGGDYYGHFAFRGPNRESVYENPTSYADPGFVEVAIAGNTAYGFDLDDNPKTGFKGVDGAAGVDNAFYKASGCINTFRGVHKNAYFFKSSNDRMRDGQRTMVVVMSGAGADPMNDPDVTVGVYASKDDIVKDANGAATPDMTFRVDPNHQSVFKAKIAGGVLETTDRPFIHFFYAVRGGGDESFTELHQSKMRLEMKPDGSMRGLVGGYREWFRAYAEMARGGAIHEQLGHHSMPGWYYALRRNADGLPDANGVNRGISATFHLYLQPAYVTTPDNTQAVRVAQNFAR